MELEVGQEAPDFELVSDEGRPVKLSDFRGQRVLLFFYPKADTPGCTKQACGFRDNHQTITQAGAVVLGISPDTVDRLQRWQQKVHLPYSLLSDPDHVAAELYGVWGEKKMYGKSYMGIVRSHFIVGTDGRLEDVKYKVSPQQSIDDALQQFAA